MNIRKSSSSVALGALFVAAALQGHAARAGLTAGIVGAVGTENPSVKNDGSSVKVDGKTSWGAGLTTGIDFSEQLGLEADLLYLNHKFSHKTAHFFGADVSSTFSSGYLQVPVLVRYRPIPLLNLGLGGYYSRVLTSWNVGAANFADATANFDKSDYGFMLAVGTALPITTAVSLTGDLRYSRSLTDSARQSGDALKFANVQALVGVKFDL